MQSQPLVSIIMNCYNSDRYLTEAIESVIKQSYLNWEIIFWDNQSTDKSAEILKSYKDDRIKYYYAGRHTALGEARNLAIEKAKGEYIAFLDCDDTWFPDKLEKQVRLFEKKPCIDFIYANYYSLDMGRDCKYLVYSKRQPDGYIFGNLLYKFKIGIMTVLIRKAVLYKLDMLFDPNLNLAEDYELFMRILYSSQAEYIDSPVAVYRIHSNMSSYTQKEKWVEEFKYINKKFREIDKNGNYTKKIEYREMKVATTDALIRMSKGDLYDARKAISPYIFFHLTNFIIYIATFLPFPVWLFLRPIWGRGVYIR